MDDNTIWVAVGLCLGTPLCQPYDCSQCGAEVDNLATHGLDSECLLCEDSKSIGTRKTHGLCGGGALRKCSEEHCHSTSGVIFDH